jgi:hypothetical protein
MGFQQGGRSLALWVLPERHGLVFGAGGAAPAPSGITFVASRGRSHSPASRVHQHWHIILTCIRRC